MIMCPSTFSLVKVCGLTRQEDAHLCAQLRVNLAGFIFHPDSPRNIAPEAAAAIDTGAMMRVGVFVRQSVEEVREIMSRARLHLAQLHGDQVEAFCEALGRNRVMRVFWPERHASREDLEREMARFVPLARYFLLDAGSGGGGHGRATDFTLLAGLRVDKSWFLAGGLGPDNLAEALLRTCPCGVDLNSGVEASPGIKDHDKVRTAMSILGSISQQPSEKS